MHLAVLTALLSILEDEEEDEEERGVAQGERQPNAHDTADGAAGAA